MYKDSVAGLAAAHHVCCADIRSQPPFKDRITVPSKDMSMLRTGKFGILNARCLQVLAAVVVGRRSLQEEPGGQQALLEAQALHKATKALCKVQCRPLHILPRPSAPHTAAQ